MEPWPYARLPVRRHTLTRYVLNNTPTLQVQIQTTIDPSVATTITTLPISADKQEHQRSLNGNEIRRTYCDGPDLLPAGNIRQHPNSRSHEEIQS